MDMEVILRGVTRSLQLLGLYRPTVMTLMYHVLTDMISPPLYITPDMDIWVHFLQDAMLSQGEPRDAASFDTTASCMRLLWYTSIYNDYAQPTFLQILMGLCFD